MRLLARLKAMTGRHQGEDNQERALAELGTYFQKEMLSLRNLCIEAGAHNPMLAQLLQTPGSDQGIERVLEGLAFLAARLQQKIDDSLPEITHGLFGMICPDYLRPFPSASILEYRPDRNITETTLIPKGTAVSSKLVDGTPCIFQTAYDTFVCPLQLSFLEIRHDQGTPVLAIGFEVTSGSLNTLSLPYLRLFLTGESDIQQTLYYTFCHLTSGIKVQASDGHKLHTIGVLEKDNLVPVGFGVADWLIPYAPATKNGYRIIQEYFLFPEKFMFLDIKNIDHILKHGVTANTHSSTGFELHFYLTELPYNFEQVSINDLRLFCTPIVNIFKLQSVPTVIVPGHDHLIVPNHNSPSHYDVFSVDRVSGWSKKSKKTTIYKNALFECTPFFETSPTYLVKLQTGIGETDIRTYLNIQQKDAEELTISFELTCTNGSLPHKLEIGDIASAGDNGGIPYTNILPVTAPVPPQIQSDKLWRLLSGLSVNLVNIGHVVPFRAFLSEFAFGASYSVEAQGKVEKCCAGIVSVCSKQSMRLNRGLPVQGVVTEIVMDERSFECTGEVFAFCAVLTHFLSIYTTPYSFHRTMVRTLQGHEYNWPPFWELSN